MNQLSKADRVREWLKVGEMPSRDIADVVGCHSGFVRAIKQRMLHPERENERERKRRHSQTEAQRERQREYSRKSYQKKRVRMK